MKYLFEKAVDLTQELANGMPTYPGNLSPSFTSVATIEQDGVNLTRLVLGSHAGTHVDAPFHFIQGATTVDKIPVPRLIGEAVVGDFSERPSGSGLTGDDLSAQFSQAREGDIAICYTGCSEHWGDASMVDRYTYLTTDAADYLIRRRFRAVGIDFLSVEKFGLRAAPVHKALLGQGMFLVEGLSSAVKGFVGERFLFIALPIRLKAGDGAPCRALGVPMEP